MTAVAVALGDVAVVAAASRAAMGVTGSLASAAVPAAQTEAPLVESIEDEALQAAIRRGVQQLDQEEKEAPPEVLDLDPQELRGVIEALLLVATKPLRIEQFQKALPGAEPAYLGGFLRGLSERFQAERRGWDLRLISGGWQLLTRADFHPWVRRLSRKELPSRLTRSAMETLAIVAYKQPITRGQIEDIRGVQAGPMLRQLMDMKLVKVEGRAEDLLGRPLLYATTEDFLQRFGLGTIADLPRGHELG